MPRNKRIDIPGAVHHVIVRGLERRKLFNDDADYKEFISRFSRSLKTTKSFCYAWALMSNHLHLLIRSGARPLSELMRSVLTGYAVYFNRKNKRHGYLYQNRYKSVLCQEDAYLLKLVAYIHLNPIRAKIVKDMKGLATHKWCGHGAIIGKDTNEWQDADYVLSMFSTKEKEARKKYCEFLENELKQSSPEDFETGGLRRSCGGWVGVERLKKDKIFWRGDERLLGDSDFVDEVLAAAEEELEKREKLKVKGWDLDKVIAHICKKFKLDEAEILKKGRADIKSKAKVTICYLAYRELGVSGAEIGRRLEISKMAVSKNIKKGEKIVEKDGVSLLSL